MRTTTNVPAMPFDFVDYDVKLDKPQKVLPCPPTVNVQPLSRIQHASDPSGPWTTFATLTAPPDGLVEHLDIAPLASPAFYRIAAP